MEFILLKQTEVAVQHACHVFNQNECVHKGNKRTFPILCVLISCQLPLQLHSYLILCIAAYIAKHSWISCIVPASFSLFSAYCELLISYSCLKAFLFITISLCAFIILTSFFIYQPYLCAIVLLPLPLFFIPQCKGVNDFQMFPDKQVY